MIEKIIYKLISFIKRRLKLNGYWLNYNIEEGKWERIKNGNDKRGRLKCINS